MRKTRLKMRGTSDTSVLKEKIQDKVRDIVILRDGGCVLRNPYIIQQDLFNIPPCNGYRKDGELILQADHLITRANSATFAETRLIVCVCKGHHGWKKWHEEEYNAVLRGILPQERVDLWDRCKADRWKPRKAGVYDWKLSLVALEQEYQSLLSNM